jgi:hypothetical protein
MHLSISSSINAVKTSSFSPVILFVWMWERTKYNEHQWKLVFTGEQAICTYSKTDSKNSLEDRQKHEPLRFSIHGCKRVKKIPCPKYITRHKISRNCMAIVKRFLVFRGNLFKYASTDRNTCSLSSTQTVVPMIQVFSFSWQTTHICFQTSKYKLAESLLHISYLKHNTNCSVRTPIYVEDKEDVMSYPHI